MTQLKPVKSSNIEAVGHDADKNELHVKFKGGGIHIYSGVTPDVHNNFVNADSIGKHFHANIRSKFPSRKHEE